VVRPRSTPEGILRLGTSFWASRTLLAAVELGLFTELAQGPLDELRLRTRLGLHERGARDFFDALVALGLLRRRDGLYRNTTASDAYLDKKKPRYIGGLLEMLSVREFAHWAHLTQALRSGRPQSEARNGGEPFERLYEDPHTLETFLSAMTGASMAASRALAGKFPWRRYGSFADIGCAQGGTAVCLAQSHPHLAGVGFDLPVVQGAFEEYVERFALSARVRFAGGDFFAVPLPSADVLLMVQILHDWNLERKQLLLAKAYAALEPGGVLIVVDAMIDAGRSRNAFALLMSLNMLIETSGGFDYTATDCAGWLKQAGFARVRARGLGGPYSMVIGTK
jgi:SAM-dependent methyltransferase